MNFLGDNYINIQTLTVQTVIISLKEEKKNKKDKSSYNKSPL